MNRNPASCLGADAFDTLTKAAMSKSGTLQTGSSGRPWGKTLNLFKPVLSMVPDSGPQWQGDVDFSAETNFGSVDQSAFCIIVFNGLDGPIRQTDYYRGSGDMTSYPYYDDIVYPKDKTGKRNGLGQKETYDKQVPGRQIIMRNRRYGIPKAQQVPDIETRGVGIWTFERRGGFYGVDCAIELTCDDPVFSRKIAISGGVSHGGTPGLGVSFDFAATGKTLEDFHNDTGAQENGASVETDGMSIKAPPKTIDVKCHANITNVSNYNEFVGGLQATQLWTIAVVISKTVT